VERARLRRLPQAEHREAAIAGDEVHGEDAAGEEARPPVSSSGVDLVRRALREGLVSRSALNQETNEVWSRSIERSGR